MADNAPDDEEKPYEPTQKRLDDARRRGEVPLSQDLTTTGAYAGLVLAGAALGSSSLGEASMALAGLLERSDDLSAALLDGPATGPLKSNVLASLSPTLPWVALPFVAVLLSVAAQQGLAVSGKKIAPKFSRISPLAIAKQKFGRDGLFNFAKSLVKLLLFSALLAIAIIADLGRVLASPAASATAVTALMLQLSLKFLAVALIISFCIGLVDFLWQRTEHRRKHRMSHKELRDEAKESEGDPHLKQQRRQRGNDIATNRMMRDVPSADVVIVNPTHYAVALNWKRGSSKAPVCVAKGVDETALRIRLLAQENGIPLRRDPATARALHATVEIGCEIKPEHYRAVAAAIRFADAVKQKKRFGTHGARPMG